MRLLAATSLLAIALLASAAGADAAPREIASGNYAGISVDDGFVYWAKTAKGCGGCRQIGRTDLKSGLTESFGQLPGSRHFFSMHSGGGRTIVGTLDGNERTAVYDFRSGHKPRRLLQRFWHENSKRECGAVVYPGAVSPDGEASWDLLVTDPPTGRKTCSSGTLKGFVDRTFTQLPGQRAQPQAPVWRGHIDRLVEAIPFTTFSRTIALNSNFLLLARSSQSALLINRKTGKRSIRPFAPRVLNPGLGNVLASDGSTIGSVVRERKGVAWEEPVLSRKGVNTILNSYASGLASDAYFCGDRIVQISHDPPRPAVVLRDARGELITTLLAPDAAELGEVISADCDASTLVIQSVPYELTDDEIAGGGVSQGSGGGLFGGRTLDGSKTWAIDLPSSQSALANSSESATIG